MKECFDSCLLHISSEFRDKEKDETESELNRKAWPYPVDHGTSAGCVILRSQIIAVILTSSSVFIER